MKIGPKFKIARRLGSRIFPKTQTTKFSTSAGGQGGGKGRPGGKGGRPRQMSEFGTQLIEKQKARLSYGLAEHQFAKLVNEVQSHHVSDPAAALFELLERRLDNVVFRLGLVGSRAWARQAVSHGHITVNGRRLNIPSYRVQVGDTIAVRPQSAKAGTFQMEPAKTKAAAAPAWLAFDGDKKAGAVSSLPQMTPAETDINFGSILEFYNRV